MNHKERLAICSSCIHRKLNLDYGYVCQLTGKLPDFKLKCKHLERDETVTDTIKIRTKERPVVPLFDPAPKSVGAEKGKGKGPAKRRPTKEALKKLHRYQSFLYALTGGVLVTVASAVAWTVATATTGYQGAYMAVGVGLLVGLAVRFFGAGIYRVFGILAVLFTLAGSLLGYYLSRTGFLADVQSAEYMKVLDYLHPDLMFNAVLEAFVPLDLLYYGLAILLGYLLAIRRVSSGKLAKLAKGGYKGAPALYWLRLPLILAGILLTAYYGYTMSTQGTSGWSTRCYPSGEKMSEGEMQRGVETGKWTRWHENGNMKSIGNYTEGQRDSIWQWFDESGILTGKGTYINGVENGTWMHYHLDGVVSDSGAYLDGMQNGLWKYWYENGRLKSVVTFKAGKRDGERTLWSDSGKVVKVENFENGKRVD
ncbi:MAG: toxin-antitoxin system YwqK family antitoxin [Bacteroidota bacterium]